MPSAPLAAADVLPLDGKWTVSVHETESGKVNGSLYNYRVRITATGEMFETTRHEDGKKVEWKEDPDPIGRVLQVDARSVRMTWRPNSEDVYAIQLRAEKTFTLTRQWVVKDASPEERSRMPYPRSPPGDRSFSVTMIFERAARFP